MRYTIMVRTTLTALPLVVLLLGVTACTPTVQVAVPDKPIEINLNVKIEHEIRVKVDKELDELFEEDSELF
ncbi:YnbE family lipoprotein [Exilibacterium tricleocarpae]|uniref:YnbE family lipoprotein n=2 Tax=Exilibacterium tricleocarpae TaxID=2591008 RepID=A0A545U777_9GAMM|nr:YnbE family lipoprotein [Exilibacterium tricleocarpae]